MPKTTLIILVVTQTQTPTIKILTIPRPTIQIIKKTENLDLSTHPVRHVKKQSIPQRNVSLDQTQLVERHPGTDAWKDRISPTKKIPEQFKWQCSSCSTNFKPEKPRLYSRAPGDKPETTKTPKYSPIPDVTGSNPCDI